MKVTKLLVLNVTSLNYKTSETDNKNLEKSSVSCRI